MGDRVALKGSSVSGHTGEVIQAKRFFARMYVVRLDSGTVAGNNTMRVVGRNIERIL